MIEEGVKIGWKLAQEARGFAMGYKITSNPWFSILLRLLNSLNRAISRGRSSLCVIFFHIRRERFHLEAFKERGKPILGHFLWNWESISSFSCRRVQGTITITTARNTPWNLPEAHRWHRASPPTDISSLRHNHHHRHNHVVTCAFASFQPWLVSV